MWRSATLVLLNVQRPIPSQTTGCDDKGDRQGGRLNQAVAGPGRDYIESRLKVSAIGSDVRSYAPDSDHTV
jgi:hypothetical protein